MHIHIGNDTKCGLQRVRCSHHFLPSLFFGSNTFRLSRLFLPNMSRRRSMVERIIVHSRKTCSTRTKGWPVAQILQLSSLKTKTQKLLEIGRTNWLRYFLTSQYLIWKAGSSREKRSLTWTKATRERNFLTILVIKITSRKEVGEKQFLCLTVEKNKFCVLQKKPWKFFRSNRTGDGAFLS